MMRLVELQVTHVIVTPTKGRGLFFEKYLISNFFYPRMLCAKF